MHKAAIIARREYQALVRTKAFVISLLIMPVFMFGGIFVQHFLAGRVDISEKKVVVLDGTGKIFGPLEMLARRRNENDTFDKNSVRKTRPTITLEKGPAEPVTDDMRLALSERVRRNEIFAFVEIDPQVLRPATDSPLLQLLQGAPAAQAAGPDENKSAVSSGADEEKSADQKPNSAQADGTRSGALVRIYMESIAYNEVGRWLMQAINQTAFALRLEEAGLDPAVVAGAVTPVSIAEMGLYRRADSGEVIKRGASSRVINFFVPFSLVLLLFMSVMIVAQPMLNSVLEEKQQRIAEVLLGSASPMQIMMGKLIGNVAVALTIVGLYLAGGYVMAAYYGYAELIPLWLLGWFIVFEVLACMLYGSIFIAVGAACTEVKEAQSLLTPVMILMILPLMAWANVVQEPLSAFAKWASLFPLATPMLMLLRMAASPMVPWWEPVLGVGIVLATTLACVFAAGRVFRIGLLTQGKAPKITELARWVLHG